MRRYVNEEALVLKIRPLAEKHASLLLLTQTQAHVWVNAFGLRSEKSRNRSACQPFNHLRVWLYHDLEKKQISMRDVELLHDAMEIRSDLQSIYLASFVSELVQKTPLELEMLWPFELVSQLLRAVSKWIGQRYELEKRLLIFLWRYMGNLGFHHELLNTSLQSFTEHDQIKNFLREAFARDLADPELPNLEHSLMRAFLIVFCRGIEQVFGFELKNLDPFILS